MVGYGISFMSLFEDLILGGLGLEVAGPLWDGVVWEMDGSLAMCPWKQLS